jgi:hypothetical protein
MVAIAPLPRRAVRNGLINQVLNGGFVFVAVLIREPVRLIECLQPLLNIASQRKCLRSTPDKALGDAGSLYGFGASY